MVKEGEIVDEFRVHRGKCMLQHQEVGAAFAKDDCRFERIRDEGKPAPRLVANPLVFLVVAGIHEVANIEADFFGLWARLKQGTQSD